MDIRDVRRHRRQVREFHRATGAFFGEAECCCGVTLPQCHVLLELEASGSPGVVDLAHRLELNKSTVSRTVDRLVELGLVTRSPDSDDRRYVVVTLTDEGASTVARINSQSDRNVRKIFAHIPEDRHRDVLECMDLLLRALRATDNEETACATKGGTTE